MWFLQYHRTLNMIGILLATAGVVAIFWAFDWTWMGPQPGNSANEVGFSNKMGGKEGKF